MDEQGEAFLDAVWQLDRRELAVLRGALSEIDGYTRDSLVSVDCHDGLACEGTLQEKIAAAREALKDIRDIATEEWTYLRAKAAIDWAENGADSPYLDNDEELEDEHWFY